MFGNSSQIKIKRIILPAPYPYCDTLTDIDGSGEFSPRSPFSQRGRITPKIFNELAHFLNTIYFLDIAFDTFDGTERITADHGRCYSEAERSCQSQRKTKRRRGWESPSPIICATAACAVTLLVLPPGVANQGKLQKFTLLFPFSNRAIIANKRDQRFSSKF